MKQTEVITKPTTAEKIYKSMLFLYPKQYRKRFADEMLLDFHDLYNEEIEKNGSIFIGFWFRQFTDIVQSVIDQHVQDVQKHGMKKYLKNTLHLNIFNLISFILLLPFLSLLAIDFGSRLIHYNRQAAALLQHSFFYSYPILFTGIVIFPLLAVVLSFVPLSISLSKKHARIFSWRFVFSNFFTFTFLGIGLFALLVVFGHDFIPCMVNNLFKAGFEQSGHIVAVCRNA